VLGGGLNNSFIRRIFGVTTHRINDIELSTAELEGHVMGSLLHSTGGDHFESLSTDSKCGVSRGESTVEVDRTLHVTGLAGQRPVVAVHGVVNHDSGEGIVCRIAHIIDFIVFLARMTMAVIFGSGDNCSEYN